MADHGSGEDGILAHVFEGGSGAWLAREADAAAQSHVVALRAEFASDERAVLVGSLRVPGGGEADVGRQSGRVAAIFSAAADAVGGVGNMERGNTQALNAKHKSGAALGEMRQGHLPERSVGHP